MNKKYTSDEVIALVSNWIKEQTDNVIAYNTFPNWLKDKEQSDIDSVIDTAIEMKKELQYAQNIWVSNDRENWFRDMFIGYDINYVYTKNSSEVHKWKYFSITDPNGI